MKRTQSGMTLIGFVVVLAVVGLFIYVGMKVIPMYTEYYGVRQAMKGRSYRHRSLRPANSGPFVLPRS